MFLILRNTRYLSSLSFLLEQSRGRVQQQFARQMGRQDQFNWKPTKSILANKNPKLTVVLQEDFKNLGRKGDIVQVKPGYARNFLIPKGIVDYASIEQIRIFKAREAGLFDGADADGKRPIADPKLLPRLESLLLTVERPTNIGWEVTKHHLAMEFKHYQIHVPVGCMTLHEKICGFGDYTVDVTVNKSVTVPIKIKVEELIEPINIKEEQENVILPDTSDDNIEAR